MKKTILHLFNRLGYSIQKTRKDSNGLSKPLEDIKEEEFWEIYNLCKPYTMTSIERMYSLYLSVDYVLSNNIEGAFVECGVWRGGSSMLIAKMLSNRKIYDRKIYLYDTYEGMSEPTNNDISWLGQKADKLLEANKSTKKNSVWCLADIEDVQTNIRLTNYNEKNLHFIKGKVEDTIPAMIPEEPIALLRLDTDWYESTKHELIHLFPQLTQNGVLIIDDYGHWEGCRKATDEYFKENNIHLMLNRIDYTGRAAIKTQSTL
jgi:O-methyltransferase